MFDRLIFAGRDQEKIVAFALGECLDAVNEAREKDVGDVGNDHADEARRAAAQSARGPVEPIPERGNRLLDLPPVRVADWPIAIDHVGRCGHRYAARAATSRMVGVLPKAGFSSPQRRLCDHSV